MSGREGPGGNRPLRFQPANDARSQLDAFLKGVYQQYLQQRSQQGIPASTQNQQGEINDSRAPDASSLAPAAVHSAGVAGLRHDRTRDDLSASTTMSRAANQFSLREFSNDGSSPIQHAQNFSSSPLAGLASINPAVAAGQGHPQSQTSSSADGRISTVNHAFIESQLNSIARASLLRAKNVDMHAPDPEQEAPPNEAPVEKRRRLERINGRRKRAKKLIEMDTLNERLVTLVDRNKQLKGENADFRQKIDAIKRLNSARTVPTRQSSEPLSRNMDQPQPGQSLGLQQVSRVLAPRVEMQAFLLPPVPAPAPQGYPQRQESLTLPPSGNPSQHLLPSLLAGLFPSSAPNQAMQLGSPPVPMSIQQQLQQLFPQQQQLLPYQQQQLPYQQQQLQLTALPSPSIAATPSSLYAAAPSDLQASVTSLLSQHPQDQLNPPAVGNAAVGTAAVGRPRSPPPRNAKELKAWIERQRDQGKKKKNS